MRTKNLNPTPIFDLNNPSLSLTRIFERLPTSPLNQKNIELSSGTTIEIREAFERASKSSVTDKDEDSCVSEESKMTVLEMTTRNTMLQNKLLYKGKAGIFETTTLKTTSYQSQSHHLPSSVTSELKKANNKRITDHDNASKQTARSRAKLHYLKKAEALKGGGKNSGSGDTIVATRSSLFGRVRRKKSDTSSVTPRKKSDAVITPRKMSDGSTITPRKKSNNGLTTTPRKKSDGTLITPRRTSDGVLIPIRDNDESNESITEAITNNNTSNNSNDNSSSITEPPVEPTSSPAPTRTNKKERAERKSNPFLSYLLTKVGKSLKIVPEDDGDSSSDGEGDGEGGDDDDESGDDIGNKKKGASPRNKATPRTKTPRSEIAPRKQTPRNETPTNESIIEENEDASEREREHDHESNDESSASSDVSQIQSKSNWFRKGKERMNRLLGSGTNKSKKYVYSHEAMSIDARKTWSLNVREEYVKVFVYQCLIFGVNKVVSKGDGTLVPAFGSERETQPVESVAYDEGQGNKFSFPNTSCASTLDSLYNPDQSRVAPMAVDRVNIAGQESFWSIVERSFFVGNLLKLANAKKKDEETDSALVESTASESRNVEIGSVIGGRLKVEERVAITKDFKRLVFDFDEARRTVDAKLFRKGLK